MTFSCAKMGVQISGDIERFSPESKKVLVHQVILGGDAAHDKKGLSPKVSVMMQKLFDEAGANATLLMLGDNIKSIEGKEYPEKLNTQANLALMKMIKPFKGKTYFLPGDTEWLKNDQEGVNIVESWVQNQLMKKDNFIPDDGCPGPEVKEINEQLVIIAFDSRWFIENWNKNELHNESCDIRYRSDLLLELTNEIKKYYLTHNVILAMHHPVVSTGSRGGFSCVKDHFFPISNMDGYFPLPLPIIGSIATFISKKIPALQDIEHPVYKEMATAIKKYKRNFPGLIIVSGHEFNLQYHKVKEQHYVISGALSNSAAVSLADSARFTYGGLGVSRLNIFEDGAVELEFIRPGKNNAPEVIFRSIIKEALPTIDELTPDSFPLFEQLEDSVIVTISKDLKVRKYSESLWGKLNTDLYYLPVKLPVLNLDTAKGGLSPFRRGGSNQTNSVRLMDKDGRLYQIRSLKKNPQKLVPFPFNKTFATDIAAKQMTAGNPFGAITLAPMEDAINIYHSNPQLVFVPKQPGLEEYNDLGNEVYLLEERPDEDWSTLDSYGNSKNIISHINMREDLLDNNQSTVNQEMVLRCRLFDMLIGDWDRHDDQWRWATFEEDGVTKYDPVPRDRDQVYSMYGGLIPGYVRTTLPFFHSLQKFEAEIKDQNVKWFNQQARNFDRLYLNQLDWSAWEAQVNFMQVQLSDSIIYAAVSRFPKEVKATQLDNEIARKLKLRRDDLMNSAKVYFSFLNKKIEIPGTHKDNLFHIKRLDNQKTKVSVYEYKHDKAEKDLIYERMIRQEPTEEIQCYGLDGDDVFIVDGEVSKGIKIRLIGGNGNDSYQDNSKVNDFSKKTIIYDQKNKGTKINKSEETAKHLSGRYKFNNYRYKKHQYNYGFFVPLFGFNSDEGFILKGSYIAKTFTFRKQQNHSLIASFAFGNQGFEIAYQGIYHNTLGQSAMTIDAHVRRPKFVFNFYGLGNSTLNDFESSNYYRVAEESIYFSPGIRRYFTKYKKSFVSLAPTYEQIKIQQIEDKFLAENISEVDTEVFTEQKYGGLKLNFNYANIDRITFPRRGLFFDASTIFNSQLKRDGKQYVRLSAETGFYQPIGRKTKVILASKLGFEHLIGDFNFYYAARIGGENNLRGFPNQRFTGQTSFYHSTDLRMSLFNTFIGKLPVTIGVTGSFDYARVWTENDDSDKWHTSYGGQMWISPLGYFVISSGVFFSDEGRRFSVKFGFDF
jgi:hypothetical protein